jgi:hypothetical protein
MEPNGATMTAESQLWAGVLIIALSLCGLVFMVLRQQAHFQNAEPLDVMSLVSFLTMIPCGGIFVWSGYRRRQRK